MKIFTFYLLTLIFVYTQSKSINKLSNFGKIIRKLRKNDTETASPLTKVIFSTGSTDNYKMLDDTEVIDIKDSSYPPANCKPVDDFPYKTWGAMGSLINNGKTVAICGGDPNQQDCHTLNGGKWTPMAKTLKKRRSAGSIYLPGHGWWLLGGEYSGEDSEMYDEKEKVWKRSFNLPMELKWQCVVVISETQVLMTGGDFDKQPINKAWIMDFGDPKPAWVEVASMNSPRFAHTCLWDDEEQVVVVSGGWSGSKVVESSEVYNPQLNIWSPDGPALPQAMDSMTLAGNSQDEYILAGGYGLNTKTLADVYEYTFENWITYDYKLKTPRQSFVSLFVPENALRQC